MCPYAATHLTARWCGGAAGEGCRTHAPPNVGSVCECRVCVCVSVCVDDECVPSTAHHESHGIARHQRRIIEFVQNLFYSNIGSITTNSIPKLVILLLTNRSSVCFNSGKLHQNVERRSYVCTLRKVPWMILRVLRLLGLKMRVSYQKTLSLTERSGRRFLTRDLAGLFSK